MKKKKIKYTWNKKKFVRNMFYLFSLFGVGLMFAYVILGICGIDIIL